MADLRITDLPPLVEADVAATDVLPIADISASATKKLTVKDLTEAAVTLIDDGSIPSAKLASISPALLGNSSAAAQFLAGPTAAAGAFAARTIAAGDLPIATVSTVGGVSVSTGLSITAGGALSIAAATSATTGAVSVPTASGLSVDGSGVLSHISSIAAQTKNGITVNTTGHVTAIGSIGAADLPVATTTDVGGVFIGSGLAVTVGGQLNHASTITAGTTSGITFNSTGHITAVTALAGTDLPTATASTKGAVSVPAGALTVSGAGALTHTNSTVTPGQYAKVTVDALGHVTAGATLVAGDIPDLSAAKITSGTLSVSLLGTKSITGVKLSDSSTVLFGGAGSTAGVVTFPTAEFKGQYFFDELNGDLYIWTGSAWLPVTITSGELVYGGTYNASTNLVGSTTSAGSAAGLTTGSALAAASSTNKQYYLVVSTSGTGTGNAPPVALAPPDMILSNGSTWDLIDVSNAIAGQTANNISFVPYGGIVATNVQTALQELDDDKLAKAGGTVTGNLEIGTTGSLTFEGGTADANETQLTVVNPTADRTITLPDVTGTVITTGDTGTVTSTMIANATIIDADVNASAAIAGSKLQAATTSNAGAVQLTDSISSTSTTTAATPNSVKTSYDLANAAMPKAGGTFTGDVTINAQGDLRFADSDSSNWVAFQAPATVATNVTWTLPSTDGSANQFLQTDGSGTLSWATSDVLLAAANAFTGANTFTNTTGQTFRQAATQDGVLLRGRAGGTSSFSVELVPTTLSASRTLTAPNVSGTIITTGDTSTVTNTMLAGSIADSKLSTISTAGKVDGAAITSGNISTSGSFATTSTLAVGQASAAANTDLDLAGTYAQTVVAVAALNIDCSTGNYFTKTINGASTFTVSNVPASRSYSFTLELTHTSGAITWFSGVEWPNSTAPTLTTGKTHLFMFVTDNGGTRWRASSLINYTN